MLTSRVHYHTVIFIVYDSLSDRFLFIQREKVLPDNEYDQTEGSRYRRLFSTKTQFTDTQACQNVLKCQFLIVKLKLVSAIQKVQFSISSIFCKSLQGTKSNQNFD